MEIDETITTIKDFKNAVCGINDNFQMYVLPHDTDSLVEITEVMLVLPKKLHMEPYLVLRTR